MHSDTFYFHSMETETSTSGFSNTSHYHLSLSLIRIPPLDSKTVEEDKMALISVAKRDNFFVIHFSLLGNTIINERKKRVIVSESDRFS